MICDFCRSTVLESGKTWGYHHEDPAQFDASVEAGCVFCTRLAERLGEEPDKRPDVKTSEKPSETPSGSPSTVAPWFDQVGDTKSLYRWNMRPAARIRETKSYVSITFRPVTGRTVGPKRSEDLPEVRFDLIPEDGRKPPCGGAPAPPQAHSLTPRNTQTSAPSPTRTSSAQARARSSRRRG